MLAMLVLLVFVILTSDIIVKTFGIKVNTIKLDGVEVINLVKVNTNVGHKHVSEHIKSEIIRIYWSRKIMNRREEIVRLLIWLTEHEDPGLFLDRYTYIQNYIFDRTAA